MNGTLQNYRQPVGPKKNIISRINNGLYGLLEGGEYALSSNFGGILGAVGKLATLGLSKAMTGNADLELGRLVERKINGAMIREPRTEEGKFWQNELDKPRSILGSKPTSLMNFSSDVATEQTDKFINEPWNLSPASREAVNTAAQFIVPKVSSKVFKTVKNDVGNIVKAKVESYVSKDLGGLDTMPWEDYSGGKSSSSSSMPTLVHPSSRGKVSEGSKQIVSPPNNAQQLFLPAPERSQQLSLPLLNRRQQLLLPLLKDTGEYTAWWE
jgi:hypothetical protein